MADRNSPVLIPPSDQAVAVGAILGKLDDIVRKLDDLLLNSEQEPDFDQTYVLGASGISADTVVPLQLPRTLKHVEITLNVSTKNQANGFVALFAGNLTLADAQKQGITSTGVASASTAIAVQSGGAVTVRDYLDGSGYLTVYFFVTVSVALYANVRVRSLDAEQMRPQRT